MEGKELFHHFFFQTKNDWNPIVSIHCDGGEIKVRKSFLTAESDVFRRMFEVDMIENQRNTVFAEDVHFKTLQFIIRYFETKAISGFEKINKDVFDYIVGKYNFIIIKDDIAGKLLSESAPTMDTNLVALEKIFSVFNSPRYKVFAFRILSYIIQNKKIYYFKQDLSFINDFSAEDFTELSKMCCAEIKQAKRCLWDGHLDCFYSWTSKNPEERSITSLALLPLISCNLSSIHLHAMLLEIVPTVSY
jgi:hypothetical protein